MIQRQLTIEEICRKLKPILGSKIDSIYLRYAMSDNREEKEQIAGLLNALYQKNLAKLLDRNALLEPPKKENVEGEYPIAFVNYAGKKLFPFALREKDWPRHVCISGMSGSGKTTLGYHIISNFIKQKKPFLVFDWKKSFRPLLLIDNEISLYTVGNDAVSNLFKININQPPKGVSPKEWINTLCDLLAEVFFFSFGVHKILLETLDDAFKEWGIYNGSKNYPTWNHIKWRLEERIDKVRGREATWIESALRVATVLTFGDLGKAINYKGEEETTIEELLEKKVIFELNSLSNIEKKFFCDFVLTYIYKQKKVSENKVGNGFNHAILVDEAHNIFLKDKTNFLSESVTDMIYREMREYGTGLICLDQHVSKLSDTVKGNSACHIAFQQQLPQDIMEISDLMQMRDQKEFFSKLPVGTAIVKLSERHNSPFLVEVPFVDLRKEQVTDEFVKNRMNLISIGGALEKNPETKFNNALKGNYVLQKVIVEEEETLEKTKTSDDWDSTEIERFDEVERAIYKKVIEGLKNRMSLREIELELDKKQNYDRNKIIKVINYVFEGQLKKINKKLPGLKLDKKDRELKEIDKPVIVKKEIEIKGTKNLNSDQKQFIVFLKNNQDHTFSTVEFYKKAGFSARKGNKIKKELIDKGFIKTIEEKNDKGWKKFIRLCN